MVAEITTFGILPDGREAKLCTLENENGMKVLVTNYGCKIIKLFAKDRNGEWADVILGHRTLEDYLGDDFHGSFVGRYANRIGGAQFTLDGKTYHLPQNSGPHTLHGGPNGYHHALFDMRAAVTGGEPSVTFTHTSPDGDEGFPGKLDVTVTYTLKNDDSIEMRYDAVSDAPTPFNPTNHSYFNLTGDLTKEIMDTVLTINATKVTSVSPMLIPDGGFTEVAGGPLDFTRPKTIGQDINADDPMIRGCRGYDHNYCVDGEGFRKIAEAYDPESGRVMEVFSDMPGVQLYTSNSPSRTPGKDGKQIPPHTAFCLETQFYPDSVNHDNFPFRYVKPGEPFTSRTVYRFSVK